MNYSQTMFNATIEAVVDRWSLFISTLALVVMVIMEMWSVVSTRFTKLNMISHNGGRYEQVDNGSALTYEVSTELEQFFFMTMPKTKKM